MSRRRPARALILAAAAAAVLPAAAAADPGIGPVTSFDAAFTTARPGVATGLALETTGAPPASPATVPPAVRQTVVLPRGTRLDLAALPQCEADDAALAEQGAQVACPTESRVGTGRAEGVLGNAPVVFDLGVYAVRERLFFAAERAGMPLRAGFWGEADGRRLVLTVPTRDGAIAPTLFRARLAARPGGARWLRTPRRCPDSGRWTARATFEGLTAVGGAPVGPAQSLRAHMRCRAH